MNFHELVVTLLLTIIAYFLYHIAKQLSYLTGHRIKISLFNKQLYNGFIRKRTEEVKREEKVEPKLPN